MKNSRTFVEINLQTIRENLSNIKRFLTNDLSFMVVVKADAYGHGAFEIAKLALSEGAIYVAVSYLEEAVQLRKMGYAGPIFLLFQPSLQEIPMIKQFDLVCSVYDIKFVNALSKFCSRCHTIQKVHVEVNTGMNYLGVRAERACDFFLDINKYKNIDVEGIFTHFADADSTDINFTLKQHFIFNNLLKKLTQGGLLPKFIHAAASSGIFILSKSDYNLVRLGSIVYGIPASLEKDYPIMVKPALTWKTTIIGIQSVNKGEYVGYGCKWRANRRTKIGIIGVGYADGFRRSSNNFGTVICKGKLVPVIGLVAMSRSAIDITDVNNVQVGDGVVIIGKHGRAEIAVKDIAIKTKTICEEITTSISPIIPKLYINH